MGALDLAGSAKGQLFFLFSAARTEMEGFDVFSMSELTLSALIGASALTAMSTEAEARYRRHRQSYCNDRDHDRWQDCRDYRGYRDPQYHRRHCRTSSTTGLMVGASQLRFWGARSTTMVTGGAARSLVSPAAYCSGYRSTQAALLASYRAIPSLFAGGDAAPSSCEACQEHVRRGTRG